MPSRGWRSFTRLFALVRDICQWNPLACIFEAQVDKLEQVAVISVQS